MSHLITLAVFEGGGIVEPENNVKLRLAIDKARAANMPKDNIERAIKRGLGINEGALIEEIVYEAFGPEGSAFIIEVITDNKNRVVADIKHALTKNGGQLAGPNSVLWLFNKKGVITINPNEPDNKINSLEEMELKIIDAGAEDIMKDAETWEVRTDPGQLQKTIQNLKKTDIAIKESGLAFIAKDELLITRPEAQEKIEKLYSALEDIDEINNIYTNANW